MNTRASSLVLIGFWSFVCAGAALVTPRFAVIFEDMGLMLPRLTQWLVGLTWTHWLGFGLFGAIAIAAKDEMGPGAGILNALSTLLLLLVLALLVVGLFLPLMSVM